MPTRKNIAQKQKEMLGPEEFYKAQLIFKIEPEPECTISVRLTEALRDEMRTFCKEHNIQQQHFIKEAVREVLSRVKGEIAAKKETANESQ